MRDIRHEAWIQADSQTVFDAITTRAGLDAWWGKAVTAEPRVGHVIEFDHGLGSPLKMRVTEIEPGTRVAWRCVSDFADPVNPASEWLGTYVVFELRSGRHDPAADWLGRRLGFDAEPQADLTVVDFRHIDWPQPSRWLPFCNSGWGAALGALEQYCTTGRRVDERPLEPNAS